MSEAEMLEKIRIVIRKWLVVGFRADEAYLKEIWDILGKPQ